MVYYIIAFTFTSVGLLLFRAYLARQQMLVPHNLLQIRSRMRYLFSTGSYEKAKKLVLSLGDLAEKDIEIALLSV